ncbi:hypothetical protein CL656_05480 [bacterium]|nr:hypothetical protein [bacterium]|tara:strand:- start:42 stop:1025 length:984 start_codon:yes stop_codon:yes gene_type:complete
MKAILITNKNNLEYLTGKNYSNMFSIIINEKKHLFTDPRYKIAIKECKNFKVWIYSDIKETIQEFLKENPIEELMFEPSDLTISKHKFFKKIFKGVKLKALKENPIFTKRKIKTQEEIDNIKKSQKLNEKIYSHTIKKIKEGVSEKQIASFIKIQALNENSEISFEPIVGFAENSANIHHKPSDKKYKNGDCVLIDMGVKYKNYCSDMTRVIPSKNKNYQKHYNFLKKLIKKIEENFNKFKTLEDIDKFARKEYEKLDNISLPHSLGHGIGIQVHEKPFFGEKTPIQDGLVFTIEPGIYIEEKYGIRLENIYYIQNKKLINCNTLDF